MNSQKRFKNKEVIGKGTYGVVYKAKDLKLCQTVAIKKMILPNDNEGIPSTALREISLLKDLNHPNIITLLDLIIKPKKITLIFEYLKQDLKMYIDSLKDKYLDQLTIKKLMYQLLLGIEELHSRRIIHRDLKPQNILIDENLNLKIADFGLARIFSVPVRPYTGKVVTLWYRAPEVLLGAPEYSIPIDIWSIGCIFFELANKTQLIQGDSENDQIYRMFRILGTPTEEDWPGIDSFQNYDSLLVPNHEKKSLNKIFNNIRLDEFGIDLLEVFQQENVNI